MGGVEEQALSPEDVEYTSAPILEPETHLLEAVTIEEELVTEIDASSALQHQISELQQQLSQRDELSQSLEKDYALLLDVKAKKDKELSNLLDDNDNLMNTITTINSDNKEQQLALKNENDQLKVRVKELEAGAPVIEKKTDFFGSFFGTKPTTSTAPVEGTELKRVQDDVLKSKQELEVFKAETTKQMKQLESEKEILQSQLQSHLSAARETQSQREALEKVLHEKSNRLTDADAQLEVAQSQLQAFKTELVSLASNSSSSVVQTAGLTATLEKVTKDHDEAVSKLKETSTQLQEVREALEVVQKEYQNFKSTSAGTAQTFAAEQESVNQALQQKLDKLNVVNAELLMKLNMLEDQTTQTSVQSSTSLTALQAAHQQELQTITQSFESTTSKLRQEHERELTEVKNQVEALLTSKLDLQSQTKDLQSQLETQTKDLQSQLETQTKDLQSQLETQTKDLQSKLEDQSKDLSQQKTGTEQELLLAQERIDSLQIQISQLTEEIQTLKSAKDSALQSSDQDKLASQEALNTLEVERDSLKVERDLLKVEKDSLNVERDLLKAKLEESESDKSVMETDAKSRWEAANASLQEAELTMAGLKEQLEKVTKEKTVAAKKLKASKTQNTKLTEEVTKVTSEATIRAARITELETQVASLSTTINSTSGDRDSLLARLTDIKQRADHTNEQLVQIEAQRDNLLKYQELYDQETLSHTETRSLLESTQERVSFLEAELEIITKAKTTFESKSSQLQTLLDAQTATLEETKTALDIVKATLEQRQEELKQLAVLNEQIERLEPKVTSLKTQLDKERAKATSLEQQLDLEKDANRVLKGAKEDLIQASEATRKGLESDLEMTKSKLEFTVSELSATTAELNAAKSSFDTTSIELQTITKTHERTVTELTELNVAHDEIKSTSDVQLSELKSQVDGLEQKLRDKEMEFKIAEKQNLMTIQQLKQQIKTKDTTEEETPARKDGRVTVQLSSSIPGIASSSHRTPQKSASGISTPKKVTSISPKVTASSGSPLEVPTDIEALSRRIGRLTQQNFSLQEQVKALDDQRAKIEKESRLKSQWIRLHSTKGAMAKGAVAKRAGGAAGTANGKSPSYSPSQQESGFFSTLFNSPSKPDPSAEVNQAMGTVLEETLLKNMQLQEDIKIIAGDVETLQKQNRMLMEKMVENSIEVPILQEHQSLPAGTTSAPQ